MSIPAIAPHSPVAVMLRDVNALTRNPALCGNPDMIEELLRRRAAIASAAPGNDVDALTMLEMAKGAANVLRAADELELESEAIRRLAAELYLIAGGVAAFLERRLGVTATELGLDGYGQSN